MTKAKFTATVLAGHKQAAVEVPFDPAKQWGIAPKPIRPGHRGHEVQGSFAGVPFRSFVVPRSRRFWVLVDDRHLEAAGVSVGDSVNVSLEPVAS